MINFCFALLLIFLIFFSAGCGLVTAEQETEPTGRQEPAAQAAEKPAGETESIALAESGNSKPEVDGPPKTGIQSLSRNELRRVQAALKENDFDPGVIDGILGPRTKEAFRRLQLGCSKLQDIAEFSGDGKFQLEPGAGSTSLSRPVKVTFSHEKVQQIQGRLKHAGFDPGPVDGRLGPRTRSALLRVRSACSLANQFRGIEAENFSAAENPQVPTASFTPPGDTRASNASGSSDYSDPGRNGLSFTADTIAGVDEIRLVQVTLKNAGFDPGPVDGIFGPRTRSALQRYQASNGVRNVPVRASGTGSRKEY